jgi:PAS domain-containing protein
MGQRGQDERKAGAAAGGTAVPVGELPPQMFSPQGMLALADLLPVMVAYVGPDLRFRFMNKSLADWFERPRGEMIGQPMREVLGEDAFRSRQALLEAALAGERKFFASEIEHPTRGPLAVDSLTAPPGGNPRIRAAPRRSEGAR